MDKGEEMSWNYRVIHQVVDGEHQYDVHECYYNKAGSPVAISKSHVAPFGETFDSLRKDMKAYMRAIQEPILEYNDFTIKDDNIDRGKEKPMNQALLPVCHDSMEELRIHSTTFQRRRKS